MSFGKPPLFVLFATLAILGSGQAFSADVFDIWSVPSTDFGSWNNGGTLAATVVGCIESFKGSKTRSYKLTLDGDGSGSDLHLYRNGDSSQTGNNRIQIDISVRDIKTKPSYEEFSNGSETSERKGQKSNCPSGDNGELKFVILQSELASANGGNYSATFELSGRGGNGYRKNDSTSFQVSISIDNPQVKISGLQDVDLTTDATSASGITADEKFCVYSDATDYGITISSSEYEQGDFALASSSGEKLGIALLYSDNASGTSMQSVQPSVTLTGSGDSSSNSCGGNDNATLRISIPEAAIREAKTGSYATTLTLLVEPI